MRDRKIVGCFQGDMPRVEWLRSKEFLMERQNSTDAGSLATNSSPLSSESLDEDMSGELSLDELAEITGGAKHTIANPKMIVGSGNHVFEPGSYR